MTSYAEDTTRINATVGEVFTLELKGAGGSGHRWYASAPDNVASIVDERTVPSLGIGGKGRQIITIRCNRPGGGEIALRYGPAWAAAAKKELRIPLSVSP